MNAFTTVNVALAPAALLQGEVCRRPPEVVAPHPQATPTVRRGVHELTPIEAQFYDELKETDLVLAAEVAIETTDRQCRPDFVIYHHGGAIAIELDGHEAHKTREQRRRDARKDRWLQSRGVPVLRWTGSDVYRDAAECVRELREICGASIGDPSFALTCAGP